MGDLISGFGRHHQVVATKPLQFFSFGITQLFKFFLFVFQYVRLVEHANDRGFLGKHDVWLPIRFLIKMIQYNDHHI